MSFAGDLHQHRDALLRMIDAGVSVAVAGQALGISRSRCYAIMRACGRGPGKTKTVITARHRERVITAFTASASINQAAITTGISHGAARRILVAAGLLSPAPLPAGKAQARTRSWS